MRRERIINRWLCLAALAALAPLQGIALVITDGEGVAVPAGNRAVAETPTSPKAAAIPRQAPASPEPSAVAPRLVTEADAVRPAAASSSAPASFAERFPAQAAAAQHPDDPSTARWALLIGINDYRGSVADNVGSRQDAEDLRSRLLANGWRDDHILLLTDRAATRANIADGIRWLAERTDEDSVAVFHYSGHSKKWYDRDIDGDGEDFDVGLWPHGDRFISDSELAALLDPVQPDALWISFATCNAGGLADPGLVRPGRILTFSSGEPQKSYENPAWGNSVWGWLMFEQAFAAGVADTDRDGWVSVEEAFAWARPRASDTTRDQRYGPQDGVMVDMVDGGFDLLVPGAARPASETRTDPQPAPRPRGDTEPPRERTERNHGNRICLLCDT